MINVNRLAALSIKDYYDRMARVSKDRSYWYGIGSFSLGYKYYDSVDADDLYALVSLGKSAAKEIASGRGIKIAVGDIEKHQDELERKRIQGWDETVKAPKSVALAFLGHPDEEVRDALGLAHQLALQESLRFEEKMAGCARVTKDGEVSLIDADMAFAVFTHFTNRNNEPLLHSHVIIPNVVHCKDDKWRALHNEELHQWYMAAGAVYRASLRKHVRRLLNVELTVHDGWKTDIAPLLEWKASDGTGLLETYSSRRKEMLEEQERREEASPTGRIPDAVKRQLAVMTRKAKDFGDGDARIDEIAEEFRQQLKDVFKLGDTEWREIIQLRPEPLEDEPVAGLWLALPNHLAAYGPVPTVHDSAVLVDYMARVLFDEGGGRRKEGALSGRAYISVQDIYKTVYDLFGGFVSDETLQDSLSKLLSGAGSDEKLRLIPLAAATYVAGKKVPLSRIPIRFYATRAVLNSEATVLALAEQKTRSAILEADVVNQYLADTIEAQKKGGGFVLSEEQQSALRHLFSSETSATLLMGAQGAGKTTMFSHFARLSEANEITVWGLAPTGTAAQKLGDTLRKVDANAKSMTIESFVGQVLTGSLTIPKNLCLILDESSQVDTLELAETLDIVTKSGAKLILVGDDRQLGSVRYGGMFATLFAKLGGARLTETRRAADAWDRTAQQYLRMGDLKEAIRVYEQAGRISVADDQRALVESVGGWLKKEFDAGTDSFVITNTKTEEQFANSLARQIWSPYRQEWLRNYLDAQVRHHRLSNESAQARMRKLTEHDPAFVLGSGTSRLELKMGDLVAVRQSLKVNKDTWLRNGQRGRIVDITDKSLLLFIQDESSARHVRVPISVLTQRPAALSYGWASTVYRTQSMELGTAKSEVAIADIIDGITPDTPVQVKKTTRRSRCFEAEFLESKGDKVSVRLKNGKIRSVSCSRVFLSEETENRIEHLIVEGRDGNALVMGTEGMNLDALLVSASRARQRTDFLFRSVKSTESDLATEKLLADAGPEELARATLALYLARQSQPEQPDSAYLRLAREREAIGLAATVDLPVLEALRLWLADNLTSGTLDISVDEQTAKTAFEAASTRMAKLEGEMSQTDDSGVKAHLAAEIDSCAAEIDYAQRELARLKVFDDFIGHAEGALSDKAGRIVIDERYVKDRISLVDEAIAYAEDKDSWVEISEAIEVPLPENTAREVVDMSSKEQVTIDRRKKLFSCVNYRVASDWMVLADALYDKMLADNLSTNEVLASVDLDNSDKQRLTEAFGAVAINRAYPTSVGHPVTLRALREEALSEEVDPELLAAIDRITESLAEHDERRNERKSEDEGFFNLADEEEDYGFYDEVPLGDESNYFVVGEDVPDDLPYEYNEADEYDEAGVDYSAIADEDEQVAMNEDPPINESANVDQPIEHTEPDLDVHEDQMALDTSTVDINAEEPEAEEALEQHKHTEREYVGGFFYVEDGVWIADMDRRAIEMRAALERKQEAERAEAEATKGMSIIERREWLLNRKPEPDVFNVDTVREIVPGSGLIYDPSLDPQMVTRRAAEEAEWAAWFEKTQRENPVPRRPSYGNGEGKSRGRGYGYRPS